MKQQTSSTKSTQLHITRSVVFEGFSPNWPATTAPLGGLLEMQIIGSHFRLTELEGWGPQSLISAPGDSDET